MRSMLAFLIGFVFSGVTLITIPGLGFANKTVTLVYATNPDNPAPCNIPGMEGISLTFDVKDIVTPDRGLPFFSGSSKTVITPTPTFKGEEEPQICGYYSSDGGIIVIGNKKYPLRWMSIWTSIKKTGFLTCSPNDYQGSLRISSLGAKSKSDCFIALKQK